MVLAVCVLLSQLGFAAVRTDQIEVELIAEHEAVRPGEPFWVALRLVPEAHWHIYWRNPGESGLPPDIEWELPAGSRAGPITWPYPERFLFQDVVSYGYEGETLLMVRIEPPETLTPGHTYVLGGRASWLACKDICVPGSAELELSVPVVDASVTPAPGPRADAFTAARTRLPRPAPDWQAGFALQDGRVYLRVKAPGAVFQAATDVEFFPYDTRVVAHGAKPDVRWRSDRLDLRQKKSRLLDEPPEAVDGVVVIHATGGSVAYEVSAAPGLQVEPAAFLQAQSPATASTGTLVYAMVAAMLGGVFLNLMPCVFPVLSFKAMHLVECAKCSHAYQRLQGIAYTLGAMLFFALLAGILLLFRAGGENIGWGFQLQSPWFVAVLAYLLFIMALSFSGVLELGAGMMGVGDRLSNRGGLTGSFFTGALAAVVASPCTAPFMGTAVAFAIAQSPAVALSVFMALGFGMALPFLVISFAPAAINALPRPGPWMERFKQVLAFPLYLTAVWLLWVLGRQTDASTMASVLAGMVLLAFAAWVWRERRHTTGRWRTWAAVVSSAAVAAAFATLNVPLLNVPALQLPPGDGEANQARWEPYSAERLASLRAQGKPVFVNMTADWCITCIANEQVALSFPSVERAFQERDIVRLKGDWTSRDPEITEVLQRFGREGVPLYVLYPPAKGAEPRLLPQILTPGVVMAALTEAVPGQSRVLTRRGVRIFDPLTGKVYELGPGAGPP